MNKKHLSFIFAQLFSFFWVFVIFNSLADLAQWQSTRFTRDRSQVQILQSARFVFNKLQAFQKYYFELSHLLSHLKIAVNVKKTTFSVVFFLLLKIAYRWHTQPIQEAFTEWLPGYSNAVRGESNETQGAPIESTETSNLAKQLADLLNNPDLPEPIQEDLKDSILNTFNSHINQSEIRDFEDSPQYIEMVLRGYANRHK